MTVSHHLTAIADRIHRIQETLPQTVRLIAVTKQVSVEAMRVAYDAGVRDFAESRIQEAIVKQEQLQDLPDLTWHMIGHLQSNKAAKAIDLFQWIHSVDSLKLVQRLDQLTATAVRKPNILLQVKVLPDPNKSGWAIADLWKDLPTIDQCLHLNPLGLMVIPPYGLDSTTLRSLFSQTQQLAAEIREHRFNHIQMTHLSMGMSDDYPLAIEAGSTMIRLGRVLFGERA